MGDRSSYRLGLPACLWLLLATAAVGDAHAAATEALSAAGRYRVRFTSALAPIVINRMHSWVLHVATPAGEAVDGAAIDVAGGMPAHDHGLPTTPRMTRYLGNGDYLVEGMKFHMNGAWQVTFAITVGGHRDSVTFSLEL